MAPYSLSLVILPVSAAQQLLSRASASFFPDPCQITVYKTEKNDIAMAFDGLYMGDGATAGYYGNGNLWCKAMSKVKAVETQEKEGQSWEWVLRRITHALDQTSCKWANNWARKDLSIDMEGPVKS